MTLKAKRQLGSSLIDQTTGNVIITFDSNLEETYTYTAEAPKYPVENQGAITDHYQVLPNKYSLTFVVTNTPLFQERELKDRATLYQQFMIGIIRDRRPLTITMGFDTIRNILITDFQVKRDATTGQELVGNMSFEEVIIGNSQLTQVPDDVIAAVLRASAKKPKNNNDDKKEVGPPDVGLLEAVDNGTGNKASKAINKAVNG